MLDESGCGVWNTAARREREHRYSAARGRFPAKRRLFLFLWRGKKWARARPAPPKHAPRSDADSAGCVPNSLSFATSHRFPKVTVQSRVSEPVRGACVARASACGGHRWPTRWVEWISRPCLRQFRFPRVYRHPFHTVLRRVPGRRWKWMCFRISRCVGIAQTYAAAAGSSNGTMWSDERGLTAQLYIHYFPPPLSDRWLRTNIHANNNLLKSLILKSYKFTVCYKVLTQSRAVVSTGSFCIELHISTLAACIRGFIQTKLKKLVRRPGSRATERDNNFALFICAPIEKKFNKARFLLSNCLCQPTYTVAIVRLLRHSGENMGLHVVVYTPTHRIDLVRFCYCDTCDYYVININLYS